MEAIIRKLEQEIDRDLAKLCSKIAVPVADATGAAQSVANAANALPVRLPHQTEDRQMLLWGNVR